MLEIAAQTELSLLLYPKAQRLITEFLKQGKAATGRLMSGGLGRGSSTCIWGLSMVGAVKERCHATPPRHGHASA